MGLPCQILTWEEVHGLARKVALAIAERYRPEAIVAIARGGFPPARILADYLNIKAVACMGVVHYGPGAEKAPSARLAYPPALDLEGKRVLLVDDLTDTGDTLLEAQRALEAKGPAEVQRAVLLVKETTPFRPEFFAETIHHWHWVICPWAVMEDVGAFLSRMEGFPLPVEEAARRLEEEHGIRLPRRTIEDIYAFMQRR